MIERLILLAFISLACAFVANVITLQNGPVFVFSKFRQMVGVWVAKKSMQYGTIINQGSGNAKLAIFKSYAIKSFGELVNCPYCLGPWLVLIVSISILGIDSLLVNWLVGCGLLYVWLGFINGH